MKYKFLEDTTLDKKVLLKCEKSGINPFLLENNSKQIEQIINFLQKPVPLLLINGFMGTGKSKITEHCLTYLSDETVVLKYNCFETTILDDILLSFFDDFRKLIAQGKITLPKAKSENFTQKINGYFHSIEKPIIIVLNSFEEVLKVNKQEILDFIFHLTSYPKIKIIILSRVLDMDDFKDEKYERVSILAMEKGIFERYLRHEGFKQIGPFSDELYKHTRGYYFYTTLSLKIMQLRNLSLIDFLGGFGKSFLTFNDFLLREALSFVDPVSGHLFRFLTMMRHSVSTKLLAAVHLYDEERLMFFTENHIISKDENNIYLQDYFKNIAENSIPESVGIKLHQGCIDLYNTQLPLKPLERDLLISRQTMRKEIEYHGTFIPKKPVITKQASPSVEYREYKGAANTPMPQQISVDTANIHEKDTKLQNMSFIFDNDEHNILGKIADSIKNFVDFSNKKSEEFQEEEKLSLLELVNLAKKEEQNYNYKRAISIYQKALTLKDNDDYYTLLPTIYTKLASAYKNLSDWFNAIKYFEEAHEFFKSTGDELKANEIKLEIATIHFITFKRDKAKALLKEILNSDILTEELQVKTYLALANLSDNSKKYYKKAIMVADTGMDKKVLSELYFKYALSADEEGDIETAVKFYKMCANLDLPNGENSNAASALSNLGVIYDEHNSAESAEKCYQESLKIDEFNKNYNGIYITSMKLAELNTRRNPEKAVLYFEKAKTCAKELNEPFYMATSAVLYGDFRYNRKENEEALKNYIYAYEHAKNNLSKENIEKITMRFNDIKARVGEENFKKLAQEVVNAK